MVMKTVSMMIAKDEIQDDVKALKRASTRRAALKDAGLLEAKSRGLISTLYRKYSVRQDWDKQPPRSHVPIVVKTI